MTAEVKNRIREMRGNGESYATMSATLGIPKGTIKSFCRRHGLMDSVKSVIGENNALVNPSHLSADSVGGADNGRGVASMDDVSDSKDVIGMKDVIHTDDTGHADDIAEKPSVGDTDAPPTDDGADLPITSNKTTSDTDPAVEQKTDADEASAVDDSQEAAAVPEVHICPNCGAVVAQNPGRKEKKYCNNTCRMTWWKAHHERVRKKAIYHFKCGYCGDPFIAYGNKHRKYCSHDCYIKDRFGDDAGYGESRSWRDKGLQDVDFLDASIKDMELRDRELQDKEICDKEFNDRKVQDRNLRDKSVMEEALQDEALQDTSFQGNILQPVEDVYMKTGTEG